MKTDRILVPVDFTPCSKAAFETAKALAHSSGGVLVVVYIEEPWDVAKRAKYLYDFPDPRSQEAMAKLREFTAERSGIPITHFVLHGFAADGILGLAEQEEVDLVVMGTHGRCGIPALLMGSVAEAIVRRAKCPVLTLKA